MLFNITNIIIIIIIIIIHNIFIDWNLANNDVTFKLKSFITKFHVNISFFRF